MKKILLLILVFLSSPAFAADYFDWSVRQDRDGKPAGIFTTTPFPVTEASTEYSITNDEGTKTYQLGTKLYVATTGSDAGANNCQTFGSPCLTIVYAITQTSAATNQTIIVRDGTYSESNLQPKTGAGDLTRSMIIGYSQERPIIDGGSGTSPIIRGTGATDAYVTIQRLKLQESKAEGINLSSTSGQTQYDNYFNIIDVSIYNVINAKGLYPATASGDGLIHAPNTTGLYISHVTGQRTYGHGIKLAEQTTDGIVEWSVISEVGYWAGIDVDQDCYNVTNNPDGLYNCGTSMGIDIVGDGSGESATNPTVRYNIVYDVLYSALQIRNATTFSVHHNEFYQAPNRDLVTNERGEVSGSGTAQGTVYIYETSDGKFYSNVVRTDTEGEGVAGSSCTNCVGTGIGFLLTGSGVVNLYNNLIYEVTRPIYVYAYAGCGWQQHLNIYNNTIYLSSTVTGISCENGSVEASGAIDIKNNIIYQASTGSCAVLADADITHSYNLCYYPGGGSAGHTFDGTGDSAGSTDAYNPDFVSVPSGVYSAGEGNIATGSPAIDNGTDLSGTFTSMFQKTSYTRTFGTGFDIGAYEYIPQDTFTYTKAGTGSGTISSDVGGINCASSCNTNIDEDTVVTITASALGGSTFAGWSGTDCSGAGTCVVTMSAARDGTATFNITGGTQGSLATGTTGSMTFSNTGTGSITIVP